MISDQLYSWRQAIEAIDLAAEDSRQRLNQLYIEIVTQLRQEFQATTFNVAAPSLDQKGAAEAADSETDTERLWELASHHPGEVTNHPVWSLLLLGGKGLIGKDEYAEEELLFPFAQVESYWQEVHRCHNDDCYDILLLSYTALLPREKHPFQDNPLIKALYEAGDALSVTDLSSLEWQTNELGFHYEGVLQPIKEALKSLDDPEIPLPAALRTPMVDDLLLALAPVFAEGDELFELVFKRGWGDSGVFLDTSPLAEHLLSLSKTKLVNSGVHVDTETLMPAEVYERLAKHRNSGPKSEVASCNYTPVEILEELSNSNSKEIIYPLACNPMTPVRVLSQLMNWGGWGAKTVQRYVQDNPAYVGGEVWQLMEMGRLQLEKDQRKKDVLLACLDLLAGEHGPLDSVRRLLNASIWACSPLEPSTLRLRMIQKGWASEELMLAAAWSWHWLERLAVASSPLAPARALTKLQGDGLAFIRHAASQPRRSAAATSTGWMDQLAVLAADDPVAAVRHPRFGEWLDQQPDRVAALLSVRHPTILAADDLPAEYFCWRLSQISEREQLRLLMHRQVPQQALDQLVRYDAQSDKMITRVPENKQGALADLVASSGASHHQQKNPELLRCAMAELRKSDLEPLMPHETAFFVMGFYNSADVSLLNNRSLLQLLLHPGASQDLRRHLGQELDNRRDEWDTLVNDYGAPRYALGSAIHAHAFINGQEHELNNLKIAGQLLGLEEISDGLRAWLITLISDFAAEIFVNDQCMQWLEMSVVAWPAVLSTKDTSKLVSSSNIRIRLVAVCFGALNEAQMEVLASDSRKEVRFALALLRPCSGPVLEKLAADVNGLVRKAALQNRNCLPATLSSSKGLSPLRNPNLPETTARRLLNSSARKKHLEHVVEILCWTPSLMQEFLDSMESEELSSLLFNLEYGFDYAPFGERPYSTELLSWMAQLSVDSQSKLNILRQLAAAHAGTPVAVLEDLADDPSKDVQRAVASNPACPTELHRELKEKGIAGEPMNVVGSSNYPVEWLVSHASKPDPDLRATVSRHPDCPLPLLVQLLSDNAKTSEYGTYKQRTVAEVAANSPALTTVSDPACFEIAALALLRSTKPTSRGRRLALFSPNCPPQLLRRCATSLDWRERHAVACHPATPTRQLKALEQDANHHVAQAAIKHGRK